MPDIPPARTPRAPQRLCASGELVEKGKALLFDVLYFNEHLRAFALRFEGRVVGYLNRCVHVPTEMDWDSGDFLDLTRSWIVCSIHGAMYEPHGGRCIGGPCGRGRLRALDVRESDGHVYWYPDRDVRPLFDEASNSSQTSNGNPSSS